MGSPASFWRRAGALVLDVVPFALLVWWLSAILGLPGHDLASELMPSSDPEEALAWYLAREARRSVVILSYLAYAALLEGSSLQGTLAKRLFGLRVVSAEGTPITRTQALGRNAAKILSYIPLGLGFLWAAIPPKKQAWHDRIADTRVLAVRGSQAV
jgi:uncharacterized RDD family membrane protein YckC